MRKVGTIGLAGRAGVGKSSAATMIADMAARDGMCVRRIAFADALKEHAWSLGWDGKKDERGRRFLQKLGTEVARDYNPNFWIECLKERRDSFLRITKFDGEILFLHDDIRFPNERDFVKSVGVVLRLNGGPEHTRIDESHASEQVLDDCNYQIESGKNLFELDEGITKFYEAWKIEFRLTDGN